MRWRLRATRRLWRPGGAPELSGQAADTPLGSLDAPQAGSTLHGAFTVEGWAMFPSGPPARVEVRLGERSLGRARLGLPRPDVQALTAEPRGAVAGFSLTADLGDREAPGEALALRAIATGVAGERLELDPVEVRLSEGGGGERRPPPRTARRAAPPDAGAGDRRRVLVFTHQLDAGGAQTFLVQLVRGLLALGTVEPTVVSALNGPLRRDFEDLGVPVRSAIGSPIDDLDSHLDRVEELTAWASGRGFDVALINTASPLASPGAEVAARLGIPAIWAIHESFPPAVLWADLDPGVRALSEEALANAAFAVFEAEATQRLYEAAVGRERCLTLPYGLDFEPIDAERAGFDRERARRAAGIEPDAEVVLCVGSIEPRKAQVSLAQAFDLVAERHPRATLAFVGARDNASSRLLGEWAGSLPAGDRIGLVPVTAEIGAWYGLSDLLVCASDIESLPRTVLEAMAWELPVLATSVFGLPELIDDGETGWLCADRDVSSLAAGLDRALAAPPAERAEIGRAGRALVERRHSLDEYCEKIVQLLDSAIDDAGGDTGTIGSALYDRGVLDDAAPRSPEPFLDSRDDPHGQPRLATEMPLLLHSLREFAPLIEPLLAAVEPQRVIEIGGEAGQSTAAYLAAGAKEVVCVDTQPSPELIALAEEDQRIDLVIDRSPDCLPSLPSSCFWVIDGDHNYATVRAELETILKRAAEAGEKPLILLHDVLWPWGRRDLYYDPGALDAGAVHPHSRDTGPSLSSEAMQADGFVCGFPSAVDAGGERNGVRTAVEDVVATRPDLAFAIVPAVFGLGVVYDRAAPWARQVAELLQPWDRSPLLTRLELNRIALYSRVTELQQELDRREQEARPADA